MPPIRSSDFVYERILGVRGAFATRIAYVAVQGQAPQPALSARSSPMRTARARA